MILIISKENFETSTEHVIDWIRNLGHTDFVRINGESYLTGSFNEGNFTNLADGLLEEINIVWFRRWKDSNNVVYDLTNYPEILPKDVEEFIAAESFSQKNRLWSELAGKEWLTSPLEQNLDKLTVLSKAKSCGLEIPKTLICSTKNELSKFLCINKQIIAKPIKRGVMVNGGDCFFSMKTAIVTDGFYHSLNDTFFPTKFQSLIEKEYEVRVFMLGKKMYSMAIFSQNDSKTSVDFRNYNMTKPNRTVPYQLPEDLEGKLLKLSDELGLTTGSFDIIKGRDGLYYFLEVNVAGQFGMTSFPCNYGLEKKIAEYLIKFDKK